MAGHYSPRSFFRHAPNVMLKRYFDKHDALTEYDFGEVTEKNIEPIYKAWLSLPDAQRGEMERDCREIDGLAAEHTARVRCGVSNKTIGLWRAWKRRQCQSTLIDA